MEDHSDLSELNPMLGESDIDSEFHPEIDIEELERSLNECKQSSLFTDKDLNSSNGKFSSWTQHNVIVLG